MNDKELAEAVAKELGWILVKDDHYAGQGDSIANEWKCNKFGLEARVFSWPVTGLMIEDMDRKGWFWLTGYNHSIEDNIRLAERSGRFQCSDDEFKRTAWVSVEKNYHKAIAKAYLEAKEIIRNGVL